jgi:SAM-dependent methyltransferase
MSELSQLNPTGRFTGCAQAYAKYRPGYASAALAHIVVRCGLQRDPLIVDVGCGTGISTRLFAAFGAKVLGIEPNDDMRAAAEARLSRAMARRVSYRKGQAENMSLADAIADAVLAAQAFHWFEPEPALREFHRVLKPDGWVILIWNERDDRDLFTRAYSGVVDRARDAAFDGSKSGGQAGNVLLASPLFSDGDKACFDNEQILDEEGLLGRAFAASYAPTGASEAAKWAEDLRAIFRQYQRADQVVIRYQTTVYLARRS